MVNVNLIVFLGDNVNLKVAQDGTTSNHPALRATLFSKEGKDPGAPGGAVKSFGISGDVKSPGPAGHPLF